MNEQETLSADFEWPGDGVRPEVRYSQRAVVGHADAVEAEKLPVDVDQLSEWERECYEHG